MLGERGGGSNWVPNCFGISVLAAMVAGTGPEEWSRRVPASLKGCTETCALHLGTVLALGGVSRLPGPLMPFRALIPPTLFVRRLPAAASWGQSCHSLESTKRTTFELCVAGGDGDWARPAHGRVCGHFFPACRERFWVGLCR